MSIQWHLRSLEVSPWIYSQAPQAGMACFFSGRMPPPGAKVDACSQTLGPLPVKRLVNLLPRSLTWNLKISPWKRRFLLETIIFRFHVKFPGCSCFFFLRCGLGTFLWWEFWAQLSIASCLSWAKSMMHRSALNSHPTLLMQEIQLYNHLRCIKLQNPS